MPDSNVATLETPDTNVPPGELDAEFMDALDAGSVPAEVINELTRAYEESSSGLVDVDPATPPAFVPEGAEYIHKLGTHKLPNEIRTHRHGFSWRIETRQHQIRVYAKFRHPTMSDFANDASNCVGAAAVASVIAAVVAENPAAGLAMFKPAWVACMRTKIGNRVNQINVSLEKEDFRGSWSGH